MFQVYGIQYNQSLVSLKNHVNRFRENETWKEKRDVLFPCTPHLEGSALEQCQKLMLSRIKQIPSVSFESRGMENACILPALAGPSWFHLIVDQPPWVHMILVVYRHISDRNTFLKRASSRFAFALIHVAAQGICCTVLAWIAINRGLTPVASHLLAGAPTQTYSAPNTMS